MREGNACDEHALPWEEIGANALDTKKKHESGQAYYTNSGTTHSQLTNVVDPRWAGAWPRRETNGTHLPSGDALTC
jgi:hypothetical protein